MGVCLSDSVNIEGGGQQASTWSQSNTGKLYRGSTGISNDSALGKMAQKNTVVGMLVDRRQRKLWYFRDGKADGVVDQLAGLEAKLSFFVDLDDPPSMSLTLTRSIHSSHSLFVER